MTVPIIHVMRFAGRNLGAFVAVLVGRGGEVGQREDAAHDDDSEERDRRDSTERIPERVREAGTEEEPRSAPDNEQEEHVGDDHRTTNGGPSAWGD